MKSAEVILVCGSGGVGKTTVSAALGLKFAASGLKTAVLTIDPAKRLATSLGLKALTDVPKKIETPLIKKKGGELWVMMLDTKRTFDRIVERYAPNEDARERILKNKIYQHLSQMLAGSQEYMAMERLYEIYCQEKYDVIVVDTPPMQNAVDFLDAPDKLSRMISNSMLHLLLKPSMALGKAGLKFLQKGSQQILKVFDRIIGFAFMQDISEMLIAFQELLGGFETRAREVNGLLGAKTTHFAAVCVAQENSLKETEQFTEKLASKNWELKKIVINKTHPGKSLSKEKLSEDGAALKKILAEKDFDTVMNNFEKYLPLIRRDAKAVSRLKKIVGEEHLSTVPLFLSDIHDVKGLSQIAEHLDAF